MKRLSSYVSIASEPEFDLGLARLAIDKPRFRLERKRSSFDGSDSSTGLPAGFDSPLSAGSHVGGEPHHLANEAWEALRKSVVFFRGQPVGTIAAVDHASEEVLNYDQVKIILLSHI
jgi:hypothetical protein